MKTPRWKKSWYIGISVVILLVLGVVSYTVWLKPARAPQEVVCTQEAKMCVDGSYVSRTGPNCEFAACPSSESLPTDTWKTFTDPTSGISFRYPDPLVLNPSTKVTPQYIRLVDWPPRFSITDEKYRCNKEEKKKVDGREYCLTEEREGAAGSIYNTYTYRFPIEYVNSALENKTVSLVFTLQFPQCANYPDTEKAACEQEQSQFDINGIVDTMVQLSS